MRNYHQLTSEEREQISMLMQAKSSITKIALTLGRSKASISRELKRNQSLPGQYWPDKAQTLALSRRKRGSRLDRDERLKDFVMTKLCCHYWTAEQIAGWLKHRQKKIKPISHESIYGWLYKPDQKKEKLWKFLARHKAKLGPRKSRGAGVSRIPNRVPIQNRPKSVDNKREFGHWEGDLMSFQKNSQHMLVLRERKTMFTRSSLLPSKKAITTAQKVIDLMTDLPAKARKSLTLDKGLVANPDILNFKLIRTLIGRRYGFFGFFLLFFSSQKYQKPNESRLILWPFLNESGKAREAVLD